MNINTADWSSYASKYLLEGIQRERYVITNLDIDDISRDLMAKVNIENIYMPLDNKFHLSAALNGIIAGQLTVLYVFLSRQLPKDREIYIAREDWLYKKPINNTNQINYIIKEESKFFKKNKTFYQLQVDVNQQAFMGNMTLVLYERLNHV